MRAGPAKGSLARGALALAGPLLIVAAVAVVLHDFLFGGYISSQNPDLETVFMLNHCFLGRSLAAGQIPGWNPYVMAGTPFIPDPQSGWMYLPAMALYTAFSCDVAIRLFVVLQPMLAGVALYWFLRHEEVSRPAATVGGLALALVVCASKIAVNLPFSDALAWSAVLLAVGARYLTAGEWSRRIAWGLAAAIAWGQLAAAHLSHGFVMGSAALLTYAVVRCRREMQEGRLSGPLLGGLAAGLVAAFVGLNLAHLLPIAEYIPRSSYGLGYGGMAEAAARLAGDGAPDLAIYRATEPVWILRLATAPGAYLGAACLALAGAGLWARRTRPLAVGFGVYTLVFYVAGLRGVVAPVARLLGDGRVSDFYTHSPGRFAYAVLLGLAVLAGLGVEAWREAAGPARRLAMVAPGALVWGAGPLLAGAFPSRLALLAAGAVAGALVLTAAVRRPRLLAVLPGLLAVELTAGALVGQAAPSLAKSGLETPGTEWMPLKRLTEPAVDAAAYVRGGAIERRLEASDGRAIALETGLVPAFRPVFSKVEMAQGYNPVQLARYWTYFRALPAGQPRYNMSVFIAPPMPATRDLLQIGSVYSAGRKGATFADATEDVVAPRASFHQTWTVAPDEQGALDAVTNPGFDPGRQVVLEADPRIEQGSNDGNAVALVYRQAHTQRAEIDIESPAGGMVLVRNAFDRHWHAAVDGAERPVVVADHFLQAVAVPPGRHTLVLWYDDPWIGYGLAGSGLSLGMLGGAWLYARHKEAAISRPTP
ncbi:MAG: hypothetical protein ABR575_02155 [Actinomycetota bacterium]